MSDLIECPLDSIAHSLAFSPGDHALHHRDAWIWGIVHGWDNDDPNEDAMSEVAETHGWSADEVARLRRLHAKFQEGRQHK